MILKFDRSCFEIFDMISVHVSVLLRDKINTQEKLFDTSRLTHFVL